VNFRGGDFGTGSRRTAAVVDITALVDVVFQLLIFFLLTSSYVSQQGQDESSIDVTPPEASLSADAPKLHDFKVIVDEEGRIFLKGDEPISLEALLLRFTRIAQTDPGTTVVIRGDENVAYGRIIKVLAAARAAGLPTNVLYRALP